MLWDRRWISALEVDWLPGADRWLRFDEGQHSHANPFSRALWQATQLQVRDAQ